MAEELNPGECFNELELPIHAVEIPKIVQLNMPHEEAMQEGRRVEALVKMYRPELSQYSDINPELLDTISARVGAFAFCVATLESHVSMETTLDDLFQIRKKEGYALRKKTLADYYYAFRTISSVLLVLDKFNNERGDLRMIKDLLAFYLLAIKHKKRMEESKVKPEQIKRLATLYRELSTISAQLDIAPAKIEESTLVCAKAWTYLWAALSEIYEAGRFVFSEQPDIKELFFIDYRQKIGKMRTAPPAPKKESPDLKKEAEAAAAAT